MKIIINADDFGDSESKNNTILKLHKEGIVTSTTIISAGEFFEHGISIAKRSPGLGIGIHLCLSGPFNIGNKYKTIIEKDTGYFYDKKIILKKLMFDKIDKSEIFTEYCLQIEKVLDYGIKISHLDHHNHLHLYFPALDCMIKAAKKYNIKNIRSQKVILNPNKNILSEIYRRFHQLYLKRKLPATTDGYFEPSIIGNEHFNINLKRFSMLLESRNNIIEIMLHPTDSNDSETLFFCNENVRNLLSNHDLINFNDLQ